MELSKKNRGTNGDMKKDKGTYGRRDSVKNKRTTKMMKGEGRLKHLKEN